MSLLKISYLGKGKSSVSFER